MGSVVGDTTYLIDQLKLLTKNPEILNHDESYRSEIQRLTRLASVALETPQESMQRIMFANLSLAAARLSNEFGLLTALTKGNDACPIALADLMKASGLDKSLVSAIMDYHCYHGSAVEPRQGYYAPTKLTHSLLDPHLLARHNRARLWLASSGPYQRYQRS
jgi:hypothetical protein